MARKRARLSRSSDFRRVYRQGTWAASRFVVVYYFEQPPGSAAEEPRLGLSVSKKVGGAVVRNRIKRLLRESFHDLVPTLSQRHDYVVIARPPIADLAERQAKGERGLVREALVEVLVKAGVAAPAESESTA